MPGNELGNRVHNFFAQENSSQGQQSHVLDDNWPVLNSSYWVGSQRQLDVLNSTSKNFPSQNSEINRAQTGYPVHAPHGLNFSQSNVRPDTSKTQPASEQQYSNDVGYVNQFHQNRQNEANFVPVDTCSNPHHLLSSRGSSFPEAQASGYAQEKASVRSETSVSLDLFGGQQQMNHQQSSMLQALQHSQSGFSDMQQMQQQIMMRKMHEFQMQQQLRQFDLRSQDLINHVPAFNKQISGNQFNMVTDNSNSDALLYPWTAELGKNWLHGSTAMQGSPSGLVFPQNMAHAQRSIEFMPQQTDQSLYGVPASSSKGLAANQFSQMAMSRSTPQMEAFKNSLHDSQHKLSSDRIGVQESTPISRPKYEIENIGHASSQSLNAGITDRGLQHVNSIPKNEQQQFAGRKEASAQLETRERSTLQFSSSPSEAALDPTEEKILYGSDDNIWVAFGKSPNVSGDSTSNLLDNGGSNQNGRWSALMQSAVAETSSSDIGLQEEWIGLNFHSNDGSSANQPTLVHNYVKKASLPKNDVQNSSTLNSGSVRSSEDVNTGSALGSNQPVRKFQDEPFISVSNCNISQKSVAEESQIYQYAPQYAEETTEKASATWVPGQTGTIREQNVWNAQAGVPPGGDGMKTHEAQFPKILKNNRFMVMQDVHGTSLSKLNSPGSAIHSDPVKVGNHLADKRLLSLNQASASVASSCNMGVDYGNSSFVPNNNLLNQWRNADPLVKFQGSECLGTNQGLDSSNRSNNDEVRRLDIENFAVKENSSDSHSSMFSQHASGGQIKAGLSDACYSKSIPPERPRLTNQHVSKMSAPRKFQYHPMGNLDDDVEPTFGLKQPIQPQPSSMQNTHFGQSIQVSRYSAVTDQGEHTKDHRGSSNEPSGGSFSGSASRTSLLFNRPLDSYMMNKASSPSQNMLELLHKVDQSGNNSTVDHLNSPDCNVSSQPPEVEKSDGSGGYIKHSSVSKGFGLQLGPPSQRVHALDLSLPSQNDRAIVSSVHTSHSSAEMTEKMLQTSSMRHLPLSNEGPQYENHKSTGPGNFGDANCAFNAPGNDHVALDTPYARSQLQNKHIMRASGKMAMVEQMDISFSGNSSHSSQRGLAETVPLETSSGIQTPNLSCYGGIALNSDIQECGPAATTSTRDQIRNSPHFGMPTNSQHVFQNIWNNVPSSQQSLTSQYPKSPPHLSMPHQPKIVESIDAGLRDGNEDHFSSGVSSIHAKTQGVVDEEEHRLKERSGHVGNIDSTSKCEESLGKTSSTKDSLEESPVNSVSTQKDIEAFGRSLKPNGFSNKNNGLLNQMRPVNDAQSDPSIRVSKRIKGSDNIFDVPTFHLGAGQQSEDNDGVRDMMGSATGVSSEDFSMFRFTSSSDMMQKNTSPQGNTESQNIRVTGLDTAQNNLFSDFAIVKAESQQVTSQMEPSSFNQYEHLKNGQEFPVCHAHNVTVLRPNELPCTVVKSSSIMIAPSLEANGLASSVGVCQVGSTLESAPTLVTNNHLSSAEPLQLPVSGGHNVIARPSRRKTATYELHPWQKEISDGSQKFLVLSATEGDWSKSANRLAEKVRDDGEFNEGGSFMLRSKRRLALTTQLMQQLFRPPPASILSSDASSAHESMICFASKVALGDACSTVSCLDDFGYRGFLDLHSMKSKLNGDLHFAKVMEELLGNARKLEDGFLRLDKNASISDLRVECQELEKFSVINRFARFHGRSQNDNAEASSIPATAITCNPHIQRYVLAFPVPRSLPDGLECLSL